MLDHKSATSHSMDMVMNQMVTMIVIWKYYQIIYLVIFNEMKLLNVLNLNYYDQQFNYQWMQSNNYDLNDIDIFIKIFKNIIEQINNLNGTNATITLWV